MKSISWIFVSVTMLCAWGCSESAPQSRAVYMLLDTSGTYTEQLDKAQKIVKFVLAKLTAGDSFALARIDSASFNEKDIIAKVTFDLRPTRATAEKRAFIQTVDRFAKTVRGSSHTDITGGMLQAIDYLHETRAGKKYILVFSDLEEDVRAGQIRDFPITFGGIRVIALNVTKLSSDNVDPREYMRRVDAWALRVEGGDGTWRVMNDLDQLGTLLD
jgi:hypothetical protein